ncbi:haloacid dehalogenase-like hydrolase [Sinimarinibacterium sp. CAU 1509]|uniref:HAD family hydrolase n=1 Tax=Sinimarinibacterium sp. CAU 1509 TaxID=2562283 RepID=UPI0010AD5958|nr:HAD family hydrolase [Sinimarinibacterium sp. CAU 1509]TJY60809.1 haloacid dehalogenase-like hydrolase [Sinimarinibacterium sp. CAU 1509]
MHETLAVVFDFDDTLAPDTTSGFLRHSGLEDLAGFWKNEVAPLTNDHDWDPVPAYLYQMIQASNSGRIPPLTAERLADWGRQAPLHPGVETLFERLSTAAHDANPRAHVEYYVISSGIGDIVRNTRIAAAFSEIWASEFHYGHDGVAAFPKRVVSFTDKTRYLFHIQKGLIGPSHRGKPFEVNRKLSDAQLRVPLNRMIFVGDGYTDIPCFSLLRQHRGVPIAVYDPNHEEKWGSAYQFVRDGRVTNLLSANYAEDSDLSRFLIMAVRNLASEIALAERTYQG